MCKGQSMKQHTEWYGMFSKVERGFGLLFADDGANGNRRAMNCVLIEIPNNLDELILCPKWGMSDQLMTINILLFYCIYFHYCCNCNWTENSLFYVRNFL